MAGECGKAMLWDMPLMFSDRNEGKNGMTFY